MGSVGKYGIVKGPQRFSILAPLAASQTLKALSGRFLFRASDDFREITAADATIAGFIDWVGTSSATAGATIVPMNNAADTIYELPYYDGSNTATALTATALDAIVNETCDLYVASNVQYANAGASATDVILIVGGNLVNSTLYVKIAPGKFQTPGVA